MESINYQLQDIATEQRRYLDKLDFDPERLRQIEDRLAEIGVLERKYGSPLSKVFEYRSQIEEKLNTLSGIDERIETLREEIDTYTVRLNKIAAELSRRRRKAAGRLEQLMTSELNQLGMSKARFCCSITVGALQSHNYRGDEGGIDKVEFLFSANPGEPPRPPGRSAARDATV